MQDSVKGCVCVKIRTDFVTNSSSSSFIVSFDKIPETVEELQKMMFYDYETWEFSGIECSTEEIASVVFQDLQNQIESGQKLSDEDLWFFDEDEGSEVKKELEDSNTFHFHYSDNISDLETVMEHGDIFWNFKHRRILRR